MENTESKISPEKIGQKYSIVPHEQRTEELLMDYKSKGNNHLNWVLDKNTGKIKIWSVTIIHDVEQKQVDNEGYEKGLFGSVQKTGGVIFGDFEKPSSFTEEEKDNIKKAIEEFLNSK